MEGIFGKIGKISLMRIAIISVLATLTIFAVSGMARAAVINTTEFTGNDAAAFSGQIEGFWTFSTNSTRSWAYDQNTTTSSNVGPACPFSGTAYGYTEASSGAAGDEWYALSPVLNLTANAYTINFWWDKHHNGVTTCTLAVELSTDGGSTFPTTLFTTTQDDGATPGSCSPATQWHNQVIDLTPYTGTNAVVRFRTASGGTFNCDIGLDLIVTDSATRCSDPDPATLTTTAPTSGATVHGIYKVQSQVGVEGTPSGMTGMVVNITNAGACNVTNGAMTWNAGSSRWEYDWNTSACGSVTPVTGVTINVSGVDPDCPTTVSAAAITNVTIDNTQLPSTITSCAGCHQYSPTFGDGTARNTPAGQFPGSHKPHVQDNSMVCSVCHVVPTTETSADFAHRNGTIQMRSPINGNTGAAYTKGTSFAQTNTPAAFTSCTNTSCHGSSSPIWGANTSDATCVKCHGIATSTPAQFTADTNRAAPGYTAASAPTGPGRSTGGATAATDSKVGAHDVHLRGVDNMSSAFACTECHNNVNTTNASFTGHMNGVGNLDWGTLATAGGKTPSYTSPNCTSVYCHTGTRPAGTGAGQGGLSTVTAWTNTALIGNTSVSDTCNNKCHEMPPRGGVSGDSHGGLTAPGTYTTPASLAACSSNAPGTGCHPTINGAPTSMATIFFDKTLHVDGVVQGGDCVSCHDAAVSSPTAAALDGTVTQRRAIVPEFVAASSHKRSGGGTVTNNDCGVCHMEGNAADGSINPTYHRDGYVDLRDPDTGNEIQTATWGGTGAGSYSSSGTSRAVRFSRNLASSALEPFAVSIQINQCLKCHDNNGALSTTARVPGGTAEKPFNTTISGASYTGAGLTANGVTGGVTDINAAFATTNSTYHPVRGKQNNSYAYNTRMVAPWNTGVTKTAGTTTGWGHLITCFDCHAPNGASGTLTSTVTAHGSAITSATGTTNAVELRGYMWRTGSISSTNNTTLCNVCHQNYMSNTGNNHGTGSAFTSSTDGGMTNYLRYACYYCHASSAAKPARPIAGEDVHGFNRLRNATSTDLLWPVGTTETYPPYGFIRSNGFSTQSKPLSGPSVPTGSANCSGYSNSNGTTNCNRGSMGNYTPGGVY